jgi:hypothetical protein
MAEINEIVSKSAIDDIINLNEAFLKLEKNMAGVLNNSQKLNDQLNKTAQSTATTEQKAKEYNTILEETAANQKELNAQQKQLESTQAKLSTVQSSVNEQLIRYKKQLAEENELLKQNSILTDKNSGTLEKAAAYNKILEIEKRKLDLTNKEGVKRLKEINAQQDKNNELIASSSNKLQQQKINIGNYASGVKGLRDQLANGEIGLKGFISGFAQLSKALLTNPIVLIGAAIALLIKGISDAIKESEERTNAISIAFAQFKPILRTIGDGFEFLADAVIKTVGFLGNAFAKVTEFLGINPKGSSDAFVQAEKSKQDAIKETRKLNEEASKQEAIIAQQREILADKENYSYKQRVEALRIAGEAEQKLADNKAKIAEMNLKALEQEAALDDNNAAMNDKLSAAVVATNKAKEEAANVGRKLAREQQRLIKENEADLKAAAQSKKEIDDARAESTIKASEREYEMQLLLIKASGLSKEEQEAKTFELKKQYLQKSLDLLEIELNATKGNELEKLKIQEKINAERAKLDSTTIEQRMAENEMFNKKQVSDLSSFDNLQAKAKETQEDREKAALVKTQQVSAQKQAIAETEVDKVKMSEDEKAAIIQASTEAIIQIQGAVFDFINNGYNNELTLLEQKNQQGLLSDKEYAKQKAEIEIKQAKLAKLQGIFDATINTAKAITSALTVAPPAGTILAVAAGIAGGLQVASILSQPLPTIPAFAEGTKNAPAFGLAGEAGTELGITKTGESILFDKPTIFKGEKFKGMHIYSNPELEAMKAMNQFNYTSDSTAIVQKLDSLEKAIKDKPVFIFDKEHNIVGKKIGNYTEKYVNRLKFGE